MTCLKRTQEPVSDLQCAPPVPSITGMAHPSRGFVPIVACILANLGHRHQIQRKNLQLLDAFPHMLFTLKWAIFQTQKIAIVTMKNPSHNVGLIF